MSDKTIEELQVKVSFLEDSLSDLSDEHYRQQQELELLKMKFSALLAKFERSGQQSASTEDFAEERPPHY